jgi:hypothetical protein
MPGLMSGDWKRGTDQANALRVGLGQPTHLAQPPGGFIAMENHALGGDGPVAKDDHADRPSSLVPAKDHWS